MTKDELALQSYKKLGGYGRVEVLTYIGNLRKEYEGQIANMQLELDAIQQNITGIEKNAAKSEEKIQILNDKVYQNQRREGDLNLTINKLNIEISGNRVELNEKERRIIELEMELGALKGQMEVSGSYKDRYEELQSRIGSIILDTQSRSDRIVSSANRQAIDILQDAKREAEKLINKTHEYVNLVNSDIDSLRNQIAAGRQYAKTLSETILTGFSNVELVVNSMDYSVNRDEEYETELEILSDLIHKSQLENQNIGETTEE